MTNVDIDFDAKTATVKAKGVETAALLKAVDDAEGGDYTAKVKP